MNARTGYGASTGATAICLTGLILLVTGGSVSRAQSDGPTDAPGEPELRILDASPALVPVLSFFRQSYQPTFRAELLDALRNLHVSATGRQLLNLLPGDRAVILDAATLTPTRELVTRWRRTIDPGEDAVPPTSNLTDGGAQ